MRVISILMAVAMAAGIPAAAQAQEQAPAQSQVQGQLQSTAQTPAAPSVLTHAGPVYTRGDQSGSYPQYPDLQIEVDGPPGADFGPSEFHVKADNGAPVTATRVQSLASTQYGVAASVSLDVSGSMAGRPLNAVKAGLSKFVNDAGPQDKVAIQTIADEGQWDSDWEAPREQVKASLDRLAVRGTQTHLWDSLIEAIQHFPEAPLSRRLIVISDGHDEGSKHKLDEVISAAHDRGVIVDAIGITREKRDHTPDLDRLASQTGGQFRKALDTDQLQAMVGGGIQHVKSTPIVSFRLDDLRGDGKPHSFVVTWNHEGAESSAEATATIPVVSSKTKRWYWGIGIVAGLLLILSLFMARQRAQQRHRTGASIPTPIPVAAGTPAAAAKQQPLPPRPFVQGTPTPGAPDRGQGSVPPRKVALPPDQAPTPPQKIKTQMMVRFPAPAKGKPAAWLFCEEGAVAGQKFPVDQVEYWIGALDNNHLRIADDPTVSGNHACLKFDHEVLGVYDNGSTNGTRVNGELVQEKRHLLRFGDRIRVGRSTFVLQPVEPEGQA
jgi:Mg-chelatase subunit ChlD